MLLSIYIFYKDDGCKGIDLGLENKKGWVGKSAVREAVRLFHILGRDWKIHPG